jgi:hypothetical protein
MATGKSIKEAVVKEAPQAEKSAETGNVKTVPQQSIGDWREEQTRVANDPATSLPTGTRRSHPLQ